MTLIYRWTFDNCPQQEGSNDCAIFATKCIECNAENLPIYYEQLKVEYFIMRMMGEIIYGFLLHWYGVFWCYLRFFFIHTNHSMHMFKLWLFVLYFQWKITFKCESVKQFEYGQWDGFALLDVW